MNLVKQMKKLIKKSKIQWEDAFERHDGHSTVSFFMELEDDVFYKIVFVIHDNDSDVEIYFSKPIDMGENLDEVFEKYKMVNSLNASYRGMNFFLEEGFVTARTFMATGGDFEVVKESFRNGVDIVSEEFVVFPPGNVQSV